MELLSTEFLAALAAIVVIDLVLAGDNAIVIALAARNLQPQLRKRAVLWGTAGAIGMRAAMTVIVVWLLKIPGLMLFGGLMLVWIAYRLLVPSRGGDEHAVKAANGFWPAMGTIVLADLMMGLDNVLAVAGAAHGSYLLVVLGLLISIPIVVWGSQLVLKLIDRFPAIIYLGAGVLLATAAKMVIDEPLVKRMVEGDPLVSTTLYASLIAGVLALALLRNRFRAQDVVARRLAEHAAVAGGANALARERILVPVYGPARTLEAVSALAPLAHSRNAEIHLLEVRRKPPHAQAGPGVDATANSAGSSSLEPAARVLAREGIDHVRHVRTGERAGAISAAARDLGCTRIVLASARRNSLTRLLDDWLAGKLLDRTELPIETVSTRPSYRLDRVLVPAGMAALVLLTLAARD